MGLDGDFGASSSLMGWLESAAAATEAFVSGFLDDGEILYEFEGGLPLPCLRRTEGEDVRFIVVKHPLWLDRSGLIGNLVDATVVECESRATSVGSTSLVDSFNLAHRPTRARMWIEDSINETRRTVAQDG